MATQGPQATTGARAGRGRGPSRPVLLLLGLVAATAAAAVVVVSLVRASAVASPMGVADLLRDPGCLMEHRVVVEGRIGRRVAGGALLLNAGRGCRPARSTRHPAIRHPGAERALRRRRG